MNVVIYARFSSHSQNEQSIEGQLNACYDYAKLNGYTVINEYIDRALTGKTDNRPEFQKMIVDSNKKHFQGVLVYQLDRFARNRYDSATYKAKLKKNDVRVISAKENISDDASGILVEGVLESMAEYYSAELSQKIKRGMDISASKCLCTGGNVALGYKVDNDKRFIIDEKTAPIVKTIFEMYACGKTVAEIINHLNELHTYTSRGGEFNKNSLRKMLKNKRYIGIYTYKGKEIKDGMPRIIEDELFYKVQDIMNTNKKSPAKSKAKQEYILTTKLFCGHCKEMMRGYGGTGKLGKSHYYYACNGKIKKVCSKRIVKKEYIEDLVVDHCRKQLTDKNIAKIVKEVIACCEKERNNSNIKRLDKLLKDNERKRKNLMNAIMECGDEVLRKNLYEQSPILESEKQDIEKQIALEKVGQVGFTEAEIKFFLSQLKKGNINDLKYRKMLVTVFVNAIYLYDDDGGKKDKIKMSLILNTSTVPVDITADVLEEIEENNKRAECSFLGNEAPPYVPYTNSQSRVKGFVF